MSCALSRVTLGSTEEGEGFLQSAHNVQSCLLPGLGADASLLATATQQHLRHVAPSPASKVGILLSAHGTHGSR